MAGTRHLAALRAAERPDVARVHVGAVLQPAAGALDRLQRDAVEVPRRAFEAEVAQGEGAEPVRGEEPGDGLRLLDAALAATQHDDGGPWALGGGGEETRDEALAGRVAHGGAGCQHTAGAGGLERRAVLARRDEAHRAIVRKRDVGEGAGRTTARAAVGSVAGAQRVQRGRAAGGVPIALEGRVAVEVDVAARAGGERGLRGPTRQAVGAARVAVHAEEVLGLGAQGHALARREPLDVHGERLVGQGVGRLDDEPCAAAHARGSQAAARS